MWIDSPLPSNSVSLSSFRLQNVQFDYWSGCFLHTDRHTDASVSGLVKTQAIRLPSYVAKDDGIYCNRQQYGRENRSPFCHSSLNITWQVTLSVWPQVSYL